MRRSIYQSARRAKGALEVDSPSSRRLPYICSECRIQAPTPARNPLQATRTSFSTSSRRRENTTGSTSKPQPDSASETATPSASNHYTLFPSTFPSGPPPASPFTPDLRALRKEYLQLQASSHPDLAPQHKKRHAEGLSALINEAYKTLQDPLRRAQYLLSLQGIDVEDESAKLEDKELLMEVMEAREAVEEVEDEEGLVGIREENSERIEGSVKVLEAAFREGELEKAAREAVRLRYWRNIEESIHGWEKGVGGGVNHH